MNHIQKKKKKKIPATHVFNISYMSYKLECAGNNLLFYNNPEGNCITQGLLL